MSLRLHSRLQHKLAACTRSHGTSKSELVRRLISDFVETQCAGSTPWELGKDLFGREGSGRSHMSANRKKYLKEVASVEKQFSVYRTRKGKGLRNVFPL